MLKFKFTNNLFLPLISFQNLFKLALSVFRSKLNKTTKVKGHVHYKN